MGMVCDTYCFFVFWVTTPCMVYKNELL